MFEKNEKSVYDFDIVLQDDVVQIPLSNATESHKFSGKLVLDTKELQDVESIQFRFVGAIVCKHGKGESIWVGMDKMFDKVVTLFENERIPAGSYEFPFQLSLPNGSPPTIDTKKLRIQYMLVAVLGFQNGCCGIPVLQKDPIRVRKEVFVCNTDLDILYEQSVVGIEDVNLTAVESKQRYIYWSPDSDFLVKMDPIQYIDADWNFMVQIDSKSTLELIEWKIIQHETFFYQVEETGARTQVNKERAEEIVLNEGDICDFGVAKILDNELFYNISTAPAKITHSLELHVHTSKGSDGDQSVFTAVFPIQAVIGDINLQFDTQSSESTLRKRF
ncbi:hypothetical protein HK103_005684 [Boothiomyces macroporosus]|uniref:Arrestin-like N-terminal domain-containing protein n=1 Tax=Boothiomyces macroporosus TaxID=261099 RepID=A0AAD5Y2J1_9FUNG|nr:hypothetical protein HK103_005684 [Boothiomyces macroporosus]